MDCIMANEDRTQGEKASGACCGPTCCSTGDDAPAKAKADVREVVKEKYGQAVKAVMKGAKPSCCGSAAGELPLGFDTDPITRNLYSSDDKSALPAEALLASFGCGNPTALAELRPGEVVLDLGSGGGIDVLLSARRMASSACCGEELTAAIMSLDGALMSAFVRATKP
jgi:arsenite methyltransferase